jgi:hypothetical protein
MTSPAKTRLLLALTLLAPPVSALDGPTMSRFEIHVTSGSPVFNLDQTLVDSLCRDEDGCDAVLSLESTAQDWVLMQRVRLNLPLLNSLHSWSTGTIHGQDHNTTKEQVAGVSHGGVNAATCGFNDADGPADDSDTDFGFSVQATGANAVCDLVLID